MHNPIDRFTNKVIKNNNFVIFYSETCPHSLNALKLLRDSGQQYKRYIVDRYQLPDIIDKLTKTQTLTQFKPSHHTVPIIFNNHLFIGGNSELKQLLNWKN